MSLHSEHERLQLFTRRAVLLGGAKLAAMSVLAGRLVHLQILQGEEYKTMAEENRINLRLLITQRGLILDRFARPVAQNIPDYRLIVVPEQVDNMTAILEKVQTIIPITPAQIEKTLRLVKRNPSFVPITVRGNLTWEEVVKVQVHAPDLQG